MILKTIVALPAYNEEEALPRLLSRCADVSDGHFGRALRVIVVDDGSRDGTQASVQPFTARDDLAVHLVPHGVNKGLGAAIMTGLRSALDFADDDDAIVTMDADDTHIPGLIPRMVQLIEEGNDVVIASRFQHGARMVGIPRVRQFLSIGLSWLFRVVYPISGARDYSCGFRAYRARLIRLAFERWGDQFVSEKGFACMVDILMKLSALGAVVNEVPMVLHYDRKPGATKMNVRRTIVQTFSLLARRRFGRL